MIARLVGPNLRVSARTERAAHFTGAKMTYEYAREAVDVPIDAGALKARRGR